MGCSSSTSRMRGARSAMTFCKPRIEAPGAGTVVTVLDVRVYRAAFLQNLEAQRRQQAREQERRRREQEQRERDAKTRDAGKDSRAADDDMASARQAALLRATAKRSRLMMSCAAAAIAAGVVAPKQVVMKADEPLVLRYRVVAHDGPTPRELMDKLAAEFRGARAER